MMIAARNSFLMGDGKPTARDYVQDGLIYHLDAAENIGYGEYSDSTLVWYNLKGGNDATIPSATPLTWSKMGCDFKGKTYGQYITIPAAAFPSTVRTVEWCGAYSNSDVYARMINDIASSGTTTYYFGIGNNFYSGASGKVGIFLGTGGATTQANFNINTPGPTIKFTVGFTMTSVSDLRCILNGGLISNTVYNNITAMPVFGVGATMPNKNMTRSCDIVCCGLRIYSRALTAAEVAANYAVDAARFGL